MTSLRQLTNSCARRYASPENRQSRDCSEGGSRATSRHRNLREKYSSRRGARRASGEPKRRLWGNHSSSEGLVRMATFLVHEEVSAKQPRGRLAMKRSTVVIGAAVVPVIALFVGIGVAFGTPGSGAVSVYPARGSVGSATEPIVLGRRRPSLSPDRPRKDKAGDRESSREGAGAGNATAHHLRRHGLRHRVPGSDDPAWRLHGLAYPSRPDPRRRRRRRRVDVPGRRKRVYAHQVRRRRGLLAALDRGAQHAERSSDAASSCTRSTSCRREPTTRLFGSTKRSRLTARASRNRQAWRRRGRAAPPLLKEWGLGSFGGGVSDARARLCIIATRAHPKRRLPARRSCRSDSSPSDVELALAATLATSRKLGVPSLR